ncbi:MAG: hemerythrin [Chlorobiaceae bacterium]|nr:hemerythrin [Chlorobiaceae bacterium]
MNRAIDDLMQEHGTILEGLRILEGIASLMERGGAVDEGDISDLLGFLKVFADRCHHGKEEVYLFPALAMAGLSDQDVSISALLSEHARARELLKAMEGATFPKLRSAEFMAAVHGYLELLDAHIKKENTILFPLAGKLLTEHQEEALFEAFEAHEATVAGKGKHDELHALLARLRPKYAMP